MQVERRGDQDLKACDTVMCPEGPIGPTGPEVGIAHNKNFMNTRFIGNIVAISLEHCLDNANPDKITISD